MSKIKLFDPHVGIDEERVVKKVLQSHFWASGAGTGNVSKFENEFNNYIGSDQCVAVNSGTAALHLALSIFDIKNREVIVPSLSFASTALAVIYNGGIPVFVDIDPTNLCLDLSVVKKSITKKTKAILPVHFGGMPCNLKTISDLCKENNLILIEDAAHAAGSSYKNKKIGTSGLAVCFSFHPVKNLAMPTGGAITLNGKKSSNFKKIIHSRRWCGIMNRRGTKYDVGQLGWNYYMNEVSAAIGLVQLKKLDKLNNLRKKIASRFSNEIQLEKKMLLNQDCSYHLYWIQVSNRSNFMKEMLQNGIETGIHYFPIHKMSYFKKFRKKLLQTEQVGESIVSLPIHPNLKDSEVTKIIKLTNRYAK